MFNNKVPYILLINMHFCSRKEERMATNYVFKRIEKKYLMTKEQHEALLKKIAPYMTRD